MEQEVKEFFSRYDRANHSADMQVFKELYAESFMFGGPNGVQVVQREGFLKVLPRMKAHFASMGLLERAIEPVEAQLLDSRYLLAKVSWRMRIQTSSGDTHVNISATFVLSRGPEGALSIVFQIDHQDLAKVIKDQQAGRSFVTGNGD